MFLSLLHCISYTPPSLKLQSLILIFFFLFSSKVQCVNDPDSIHTPWFREFYGFLNILLRFKNILKCGRETFPLKTLREFRRLAGDVITSVRPIRCFLLNSGVEFNTLINITHSLIARYFCSWAVKTFNSGFCELLRCSAVFHQQVELLYSTEVSFANQSALSRLF